MRNYKWITLCAAIVIIALEALLFTRASTDDIGAPSTLASIETTGTDPSSDRAASFTPGDTP